MSSEGKRGRGAVSLKGIVPAMDQQGRTLALVQEEAGA